MNIERDSCRRTRDLGLLTQSQEKIWQVKASPLLRETSPPGDRCGVFRNSDFRPCGSGVSELGGVHENSNGTIRVENAAWMPPPQGASAHPGYATTATGPRRRLASANPARTEKYRPQYPLPVPAEGTDPRSAPDTRQLCGVRDYAESIEGLALKYLMERDLRELTDSRDSA